MSTNVEATKEYANTVREKPRSSHDAQAFDLYCIQCKALGIKPVSYNIYNDARKAVGRDLWDKCALLPVRIK